MAERRMKRTRKTSWAVLQKPKYDVTGVLIRTVNEERRQLWRNVFKKEGTPLDRRLDREDEGKGRGHQCLLLVDKKIDKTPVEMG